MITPTQLLQNAPSGRTVKIRLDAPQIFGDQVPALLFKVPIVRERTRLRQQYYTMSMSMKQAQDLKGEIQIDKQGYAIALLDFVTDWEWPGADAFNFHLLKRLFDEFESLSIAFADGVDSIFEQLETQAAKQKEVEIKNSGPSPSGNGAAEEISVKRA